MKLLTFWRVRRSQCFTRSRKSCYPRSIANRFPRRGARALSQVCIESSDYQQGPFNPPDSGRKQIHSPTGSAYDLEEVFEDLNRRFFHGLMARPRLTWSRGHARNRLGHYDPAHNAIVISRAFDDQRVPRYAVEYIVYHEMLHLKHPVKLRVSCRACIAGVPGGREAVP